MMTTGKKREDQDLYPGAYSQQLAPAQVTVLAKVPWGVAPEAAEARAAATKRGAVRF